MASILHMYLPCVKTSPTIQKKVDLVTLILTSDLLLYKPFIAFNLWTSGHAVVIFHLFSHFDMAFLMKTSFSIKLPWSWPLPYINIKTSTLTITFEVFDILSNSFTCIKTFPTIIKVLNLWPWLWSLTYFC